MLYLLVYSDSVGTREELVSYLNEMEIVKTWRYDISHSFYVVSDATEQELSDELHRRSPQGRFLFVRVVDRMRQGFIPKEGWSFIKKYE